MLVLFAQPVVVGAFAHIKGRRGWLWGVGTAAWLTAWSLSIEQWGDHYPAFGLAALILPLIVVLVIHRRPEVHDTPPEVFD